jgi:16S rRNA (uracil1498-N3)-methyltransferase
MNRFFLSPETLTPAGVRFPPETAHQISRVLRLQPGDMVMVLDGLGTAHTVQLDTVSGGEVSGQVVATGPATGEPRTRLHLLVGLTQREKFEWVLQKGTEVGVTAFTPFTSSRTLVQDAGEAARKLVRWQKIAREAAEQAGRGIVPVVHPPVGYGLAVQAAAQADLALIAWEDEERTGLQAALAGRRPKTLALLIGPEGGFSAEEVQAARAAGIVAVSLGERILRMETAAVVGAALALYELERG